MSVGRLAIVSAILELSSETFSYTPAMLELTELERLAISPLSATFELEMLELTELERAATCSSVYAFELDELVEIELKTLDERSEIVPDKLELTPTTCSLTSAMLELTEDDKAETT